MGMGGLMYIDNRGYYLFKLHSTYHRMPTPHTCNYMLCRQPIILDVHLYLLHPLHRCIQYIIPSTGSRFLPEHPAGRGGQPYVSSSSKEIKEFSSHELRGEGGVQGDTETVSHFSRAEAQGKYQGMWGAVLPCIMVRC